jgi:hypothetical protein
MYDDEIEKIPELYKLAKDYRNISMQRDSIYADPNYEKLNSQEEKLFNKYVEAQEKYGDEHPESLKYSNQWIKLFTQLQSKLVIHLEENEIICPECKGLRFVLIEVETQSHIESCRRCYTGKLTMCKYCHNAYQSFCMCQNSQKARSINCQSEYNKKNYQKFLKAEKINFKDYDGKFLLDGEEYVKDKEDLEEWIYDKLTNYEDVPDYLWATTSEPVFNINLKEIVSDKCEDGYEDMYERLDMDSPLLSQAQELISQWEKEQGEYLYMYEKDYSRAVMLIDIINEIQEESNKKDRR